MKLLIIQFSPAFCHFIFLPSEYSPQQPVLKQYRCISSLNVRDQVWRQYWTCPSYNFLRLNLSLWNLYSVHFAHCQSLHNFCKQQIVVSINLLHWMIGHQVHGSAVSSVSKYGEIDCHSLCGVSKWSYECYDVHSTFGSQVLYVAKVLL
jgi:hypothetical protein